MYVLFSLQKLAGFGKGLVGTQQIKAVRNREVWRIQKSSAQYPFGIITNGPIMYSGYYLPVLLEVPYFTDKIWLPLSHNVTVPLILI
jgi:hypothetical protein